MAKKLTAAAVIKDATTGYEATVSWAPGQSRPVSIFLLRVNGEKVAHDELDTDSPFIAHKLPAPDNRGKFTFDFSIKPEVDVDIIVVSVRNRGTGAQAVVAQKSNPDREDPWTEIGDTVDAP